MAHALDGLGAGGGERYVHVIFAQHIVDGGADVGLIVGNENVRLGENRIL